jgi:UDP-glucose/iron transport system ATP-binding protein
MAQPSSLQVDATALRAENLGRSVPGKVLLEAASFAVSPGETLAIVGPSGSGKSTLLRVLNRLDEPTTGTVFLDGTDYKQIAPRELRRRVGMVTQRPFLFPGSVADNLQFGPWQRGDTLTNARIEALLAGVGLAGYAARDVANLSGGEAQRVSFARTLANSPEILLLDEPTSALDDDSKRGIEALILEIMRRGTSDDTATADPLRRSLTCLLVTHDLAQAARLAQRALLLRSGRITKRGSTEEVLRAEDPVS